ncbi:MAG: T9SS type A sorting domain-containing protein [Bacteroidia bacterium]
MKNLILLLAAGFALNSNAQTYTFSKSNGAYFNLSGTTVINNDNWSDFGKGIRMPFQFKLYGSTLHDTIFIDDYGSLNIDDTYGGEITFVGEDLNSRGTGRSLVSYLVEGTMPNRILKIEYRNFGFQRDLPNLRDSGSVQCWLYETSNIIEFRYGPNQVKVSSWYKSGAYANLYSVDYKKYIFLEGDPLNPTLNTTDDDNAKSLNGMPLNGTIYKFTPSSSGITSPQVKIKLIENKIALPTDVEVKVITIYNCNGQIVQSVSSAEETNLSGLNHGIYFIVINTADGIISEKVKI